MRSRLWLLLLGVVLVAVGVGDAAATRTLWRANVRVSKKTYRVTQDSTATAWSRYSTDAVLTVTVGDTVVFFPVFQNPRTVAPDTINYRGTYAEVLCLRGTLRVMPSGPSFRRGFWFRMSSTADSLYWWSRKTLIDTLRFVAEDSTARCMAHAH
jgi:hypothetical protein